jgi:hypothetical protein
MPDSNFDFLEEHEPELYQLAITAEDLLHRAPTTSLRELRTFGEVLVRRYLEATGTTVRASTQHDRLSTLENRGAFPETVLRALHQIRMRGNDASHDNEGTAERAARQLKHARTAAIWFCKQVHGASDPTRAFQVPEPDDRGKEEGTEEEGTEEEGTEEEGTEEKRVSDRATHDGAGTDEKEPDEARRDEVEALRRRLKELENQQAGPSPGRVKRLEERIRELEADEETPESSTAPDSSSATEKWSGASPTIQWGEVKTAVQQAGREAWQVATAVWHGVVACVRFVRRTVRRLVLAGAVAAVLFYLPSIYATGVEVLPEEAQKQLPTSETVTQTHAEVLSPRVKKQIEEAVADGAAYVKETGMSAVQSVWNHVAATKTPSSSPSESSSSERK